MKVLVTGAAGFIGANYVYHHLQLFPEDQLTVLDALTYAGDRGYLREAEAHGVRFVEGLIQNEELVFSLFEESRFDAVVHFAAETHVDHSLERPKSFVESNVLGTQTLLEAAKRYGLCRFHHVSTDEVYGDTDFDSTEKFDEKQLVIPSNPYSATKAASDHLCLAYHRSYGLPVTISRCSNNYGPLQGMEKFIPRSIALARKDEPITLHGEGNHIRDWIYVEDHCDAVARILKNGRIGDIYNVGGNNEWTTIDMARYLLKLLDKPMDRFIFIPDRPGNDRRYSLNCEKIEKELGWKPTTSFEQGMKETLAWYLLHDYERTYSRWFQEVKTENWHPSFARV